VNTNRPEAADDVTAPEGNQRGMSRRQMIKAAGIAGAAAWTAPVILDSLSSPAAAATITGCFQMYTRLTSNAWDAWTTTQPGNTGTACVPTGGCTPSGDGTAAVSTATPGTVGGGSAAVTVQIAPSYSCRIVAASARTDGNGACSDAAGVDSTVGNITFSGLGTKTLTVDPSNGNDWVNTGEARAMIGIRIQCP
jgi:hypothetical protein